MSAHAIDPADKDELRDFYQSCAHRKPEPRQREKGRKDRAKAKTVKDVRPYIMARERDLCRCCRIRPAESMHELRPKSLRGKVSKTNSIGVCGDGVRKCHGLLQRHEIGWESESLLGAEGTLIFTVKTQAAADWLRLAVGEQIESRPMREMERES